MKIRFSETREKDENLDRKIVIFKEDSIYYDLLKINRQKILEMKVSVKILKLTY